MNALNPSKHYQPLPNSTLILFHNNPFEIHIINPKQPYPHQIISCDSPIQYWKSFGIEGKTYVCVVDSTGNWVIYQIAKQLILLCNGTIFNQTSRTVGMHPLPSPTSFQLLFTLQCGKLQYNYLPPLSTPTNREYILPNPHVHNLFNSFNGMNLLQTKSTSVILQSTYIQQTKELLLTFHNTNDNIYSIINVIVEEYQVKAGKDMLLNLGQRPKDVVKVAEAVLVNLGSRIICWVNGKVSTLKIQGYCGRIWEVSGNIMLSLADKQGHQLQKCTLKLAPTPSLVKISSTKFPPLPTPLLSILSPTLLLTQKLQLLSLQGQNYNVIMPNLHARITKGQYIDTSLTKYFKLNKQIGGVQQCKIYTNGRLFTQINNYAHNLLIRMAQLIAVIHTNNQTIIYLTSPIIGTLPLLLDSTKPASLSISQPPPSNIPDLNQQSLLLHQPISNPNPTLIQITPTHILTSTNSTTISNLFQQKVQQILCACIVGSYTLMLVEKQVHIYHNYQDQIEKNKKSSKGEKPGKEEKPKKMERLHLYCFQSEVHKIIGLNNVNLWAAIMWNGCVQILQIHQKQSTKIHQLAPSTSINPSITFSFPTTINTAPHTLTLISNTLLICSNDPLHVYQPQKTTFKSLPLPINKFGEQFYPVVDLSVSSTGIQKNRVLGVIGGKWRFVSFMGKYLINTAEDMKVEIQEILAFPQIQNLLFCAIKQNQVYFICGNTIITGTLQSGQIVYQQQVLENKNKNQANSHIRKWIKQHEISYENITIESQQEMQQKNPQIIQLNDKSVLLYGQKQIWYASKNKKHLKLISYFSTPNDAFVQFRNNLSIHELQNQQFMQIFADKLPIKSVAKINPTFFAVLYPKMVVVVEIRSNGALAIYQEVPFSSCPNLIEITEFIGNYDEMSLYMKDSAHRLVYLKYNSQSRVYKMEIQEELEDEVVCIQRVKGWQEKVLKVGLTGEDNQELDKIVLRRDGQLLVGEQDPKPIYV